MEESKEKRKIRLSRMLWSIFGVAAVMLAIGVCLLPVCSSPDIAAENNVRVVRSAAEVTPAFERNNVSVVFGCDDGYAPYLGVALKSLIVSSGPDHNYDIWILDGGISNDRRRAILDLLLDRKNFSLRFFDIGVVAEEHREKLRICSKHITVATYFRLFIPRIFSAYRRMLYLDCDITVFADVAELFDIDLGGKSLGAVRDIGIIDTNYSHAKFVKGDRWREYFNSGVLLFDIRKTGIENLTGRCLEYLLSQRDKIAIFYEDQDALNTVCIDNVKPVDEGWNVLNSRVFRGDNTPIRIMHYGGHKPWNNLVESGDLWWRSAERTVFYRDIIKRNRLAIIGGMVMFHLRRLTVAIAALTDPEGTFLLEKFQMRNLREYLKDSTFITYRHLRDVTAYLWHPPGGPTF